MIETKYDETTDESYENSKSSQDNLRETPKNNQIERKILNAFTILYSSWVILNWILAFTLKEFFYAIVGIVTLAFEVYTLYYIRKNKLNTTPLDLEELNQPKYESDNLVTQNGSRVWKILAKFSERFLKGYRFLVIIALVFGSFFLFFMGFWNMAQVRNYCFKNYLLIIISIFLVIIIGRIIFAYTYEPLKFQEIKKIFNWILFLGSTGGILVLFIISYIRANYYSMRRFMLAAWILGLFENIILFGKYNRFRLKNQPNEYENIPLIKNISDLDISVNVKKANEREIQVVKDSIEKLIHDQIAEGTENYREMKKMGNSLIILCFIALILAIPTLGLSIIGFVLFIIFNKRVKYQIKKYLARKFIKASLNAGEQADKFEKNYLFKQARRKWRKAKKFYLKAQSLHPELFEQTTLTSLIILIHKKIGYNFLSEGIHQSDTGLSYFKQKNFRKAKKSYNDAIGTIEQAIFYIEKQERKNLQFGFTIKIATIYDILKLLKMIIQQLDMEAKFKKQAKIYQINLDLQEIYDKIQEALVHLNQNITIYQQKIIKHEKYIEIPEIIEMLDSKFNMSLQIVSNLQDRVSNIIQLIQAEDITLPEGESLFKLESINLNQSLPVLQSKSTSDNENKTPQKENIKEEVKDIPPVKIIREYEYIGGKIRFKVGIVNQSNKVATNLAIRFDLPNSLKWIIHEPDYIRRGDTILISKLGGEERVAISLYLEPLNCLKSSINATLTYFDDRDHPQAVVMPPKKVSITCPIFFTREEANIARVRSIQQKLKYNDKKIFPLGKTENIETVFNHLLETIGKHDVKLVDKEFSQDREFGSMVLWNY